MKISLMIAFEDESVSAILPSRSIEYDGMIPLPSLGEHVTNPSAGEAGQPISGTLVSRSFSYRPEYVNVILTLREHYRNGK
ncbi:hypothetical protein P8936_11940 [Edaphobacter paludis]|uniref:Uncharacterized protein n=1 Tax=Edaphobacter paludis TaxID=3035702 RepID=A0AAU7D5I3_9BACT